MKGRSLTGVGIALVLVIAVASTWAWAQEGGATYYACVNNSSGTIHMLQGPDGTCSNNEDYIVWNSEGPAGPQGPPGAAGPPGPQGEPGACDITRAEFDALVARVYYLESGCMLEESSCNGLDDDCDGQVDEDWDFANDANNCGGCGIVCAEGEWCEYSSCTSVPVVHKLVFVSSAPYLSYNLGNTADVWCQQEAQAADLAGTFKAWLAGAGVPWNTFARYDLPYVLPSGATVAESWADLTDGTLLHPIDETQFGVPASGRYVWTGLTFGGLLYVSEYESTCDGWDWMEGGPSWFSALAGSTDRSDSAWTMYEFLPCDYDGLVYLYCFEQ